MACSRFKGFVGIVVATSLFASSTAAVASTSSAPTYQLNPWAALAVMSGAAPVAALCNGQTPVDPNVPPPATVTPGCDLPVTDLTQGPPQPVPVPPVEAAGGGLGIDPLILVLGAIAIGIGLYFLLKGNNHHDNSPV
jgi:hypothetical protein